jgi:hypothetical protein
MQLIDYIFYCGVRFPLSAFVISQLKGANLDCACLQFSHLVRLFSHVLSK